MLTVRHGGERAVQIMQNIKKLIKRLSQWFMLTDKQKDDYVKSFDDFLNT